MRLQIPSEIYQASAFLLAAAITAGGTSSAAADCAPIHDGLVAWWQAEGNAVDFVGTNNGSLQGTAFAAGKVGQAFSFTGGSVVVQDAPELRFTTALTMDAWLYPTAYGSSYPCEI